MIQAATVLFLKVFSEYLTQCYPETPEFSEIGDLGQNLYLKVFFVVNIRKIISPSLLTRFYPRFRP